VIYVDLPCFVQEEAQLSRAYWCLEPLLKVLIKHRKVMWIGDSYKAQLYYVYVFILQCVWIDSMKGGSVFGERSS
jgi:hypothetical protein